MNDKKCKQLRRVARVIGKTNGFPSRLLSLVKKRVTRGIFGHFINHPNTVRGVYRKLRKGVYQHG